MLIASSMPRWRWTAGFTLLEVVVALAILALAMTALLSGVSTDLRLVDRSRDKSVSLMHAKSKIDEVSTWLPVHAGQWQGVFEDGYHWRIVITPGDHVQSESRPEGAPSLFNIVVQVGRDLTTVAVELETARIFKAR